MNYSKYKANINVEVGTSLETVKYISPYCYKGHDSAKILVTAGTSSVNKVKFIGKIQSYMYSRYAASAKEIWLIFKYLFCYRSHVVICLAVHFDQENIVI